MYFISTIARINICTSRARNFDVPFPRLILTENWNLFVLPSNLSIAVAINASSLFSRGKFNRDKVNGAIYNAPPNYRSIMRDCQVISDWLERTMQRCVCRAFVSQWREHSVWSRRAESLAHVNNFDFAIRKIAANSHLTDVRLIDCLMTPWFID